MTVVYSSVSPLIDALRTWSGKPYPALPADMPPCGYLPGASEENGILARVFAQLCALETTTERLAYLASTIIVHERRIEMAWDMARGRSSARAFDTTDRSAMVRLRPYEAMVDALKLWLDELHEIATAEVGVRFIDEAARRAS